MFLVIAKDRTDAEQHLTLTPTQAGEHSFYKSTLLNPREQLS